MNLNAYIIESQIKALQAGKKITQTALAEKFAVSPSTLSSLKSGAKKPSLTMMKHIQRVTRGAVSLGDW
jgi:transcriptional regulator with XRE-family HTH domain